MEQSRYENLFKGDQTRHKEVLEAIEGVREEIVELADQLQALQETVYGLEPQPVEDESDGW